MSSTKEPHVFDASLNGKSNLVEFFKDDMIVVRTEFFRQNNLYRDLENLILPHFLSNSNKITNGLNIWSVGCSDGREPYSVAALIYNWLEKFNHNIELKIRASDINEKMISQAKKGIYPLKNKDIPRLVGWEKYFKIKENNIYVADILKNIVIFRNEDLMKSSFRQSQDIIICTNVLLYYEPEYRKAIVNKLGKLLNKGGYIYLESAGKRFMSSLGLMKVNTNSRFFKKQSES